ncbi:MAG: acyl carrier protein [Gammaproteobacteria bacterium]|nr:MAG: acyl carrier protein [Gammaproteobacteria bacterium]
MAKVEKGSAEDIAAVINKYYGGIEANADTVLDELDWDSLDLVETVMCLEEIFEIEIEDNEAEKWETVADISELIKERIN